MEEVVVSNFSEQKRPEPKICPVILLANSVAGVFGREAYCLGQRCAWFIPEDEGLGDCVLKRLAWP